MTDKQSGAEPVASVSKAFAALRSFVDGQDEWGVRELGVALGLPPSTVHRLLVRLRKEGFVGFDTGHQKYRVGFEFARLAAAVMQRHGLRQAAMPIMRELTDRMGESVWLALYDQDDHRIAYIAESESLHASRYIAPLGRAKTLFDSACGVAVLAALDGEERKLLLKGARGTSTKGLGELVQLAEEKGFAVMRAGDVGSAMMIAAVVRDEGSRPVGSLGVVVPMHRLGTGQEDILGGMVRDAGERLSGRLGAKLLGGASAGTWQDAVGLLTGLMKERNPAISITPALGGGGRNLDDLENGQGAYAMTAASSLYDARQGRGYFTRPHDALRTVMHLSELHVLLIVRADLDLRGVADLARFRVSPGEQGFSSAETFADLMALSAVGAARGRRKGAVLYLDYPEAQRQFGAGTLDALLWTSGTSNPLLRELEMATSSRLLTLDRNVAAALLKHNPGYRAGRIASSVFPRWLADDQPSVCVATALVCRADRPEQEVYEFTRTIYEKRETLAQLSSIYDRLDADFVAQGLTAPLHPGALRFFREIGIRPSYAAKAL